MVYYQIADISIAVHSDLPIRQSTFAPKFEIFRVEEPGDDLVEIHHHFGLPEMDLESFGEPVYRKPPWAIIPRDDGWLYLGVLPEDFEDPLWKVAFFNHDHSVGHVYHTSDAGFVNGNLHALTGFPTDQIWLARLLADRGGVFIHSAGAILNGKGFLFVGHSEAGKSTTTQMLLDVKNQDSPGLDVEILCDDRNIIRRQTGGWQVYGSWSHGDIPNVSANAAPLHAICFLEQAFENNLIPISNHQESFRKLLSCVIKPFVTANWWHNTLDVVDQLTREVPCYKMCFDKSGKIINNLNLLQV